MIELPPPLILPSRPALVRAAALGSLDVPALPAMYFPLGIAKAAAGGGGGVLTDTVGPLTLNLDSGGWNTFTMRNVIASTVLAVTGGPGVVITLEAGAAAGIAIGACYIGHAAGSGDAYDFESAPTAVTFSGSGTGSVAANGSLVSDEIAFTIQASKNLIISIYCNGISTFNARASQTGHSVYYVGGNDASTTNASSYTNFTSTNNVCGVKRIQVRV